MLKKFCYYFLKHFLNNRFFGTQFKELSKIVYTLYVILFVNNEYYNFVKATHFVEIFLDIQFFLCEVNLTCYLNFKNKISKLPMYIQ